MEEPQQAVIEYRETPFNGKAYTFKRVIDAAVDSADAEKQFWARPVWPSGTKKIEILKIDWQ